MVRYAATTSGLLITLEPIGEISQLLTIRSSNMINETFIAEQTSRLLWSHAARQVVATLTQMSEYECVAVGCGWGLRHRQSGDGVLVVHPSSNARELGNLAVTVSGAVTHVIPRYGANYVEYLRSVAIAVENTLN